MVNTNMEQTKTPYTEKKCIDYALIDRGMTLLYMHAYHGFDVVFKSTIA